MLYGRPLTVGKGKEVEEAVVPKKKRSKSNRVWVYVYDTIPTVLLLETKEEEAEEIPVVEEEKAPEGNE